jgi:hypothetical protein
MSIMDFPHSSLPSIYRRKAILHPKIHLDY